MLSKFEMIGIGLSVLVMAVALYLVRIETTLFGSENGPNQAAQLSNAGVVVVGDGENETGERTSALAEASDSRGNLQKLVIDDIILGSGEKEVEAGDMVTVHYIGTLQDGYEFDNSRKKGEPYTFEVGNEDVIKGWDEGLLGMKVGGQRILVVPAELGYGQRGMGPIPANATLVFAIELLAIE